MNRFLQITVCPVALSVLTAMTSVQAQTPVRTAQEQDRPVIELEYKGPVRVVYHVSEDKWKDGVGKAFLYLKNLRGYYKKQGIDAGSLDIRAVVHGDASTHVLTDEAYNRVKNVEMGNPNTQILAELKNLGIHVELCDTRRQNEGWSKSDIHSDVLLASAAYARLIDLQHQGCAYIKF